MWRNKGGQVRTEGAFDRGQGRQFGRNDQDFRGFQRRDKLRDSNWTRYEDSWQDSRDSDRNFRQDSRDYGIDQDRYGRSETRADSYLDNRDMYPDILTTGFDVCDDLRDTTLYREQDIDRRNVVEDSRGYGELGDRNNDPYWIDRRPQELDGFRSRDQELRTDDFYRSVESTNFSIDTLNRYDRGLRNDQPDVRAAENYHDRQDNFRNRGIIHHHSDNKRKDGDLRAKFNRGDNKGSGGRVLRPNWRAERFNEKKPALKTSHLRDSRQDNKEKLGSRTKDRLDSGKVYESAKKSNLNDRRNKGSKFSTASKVDVGSSKRNNSGDRSSHRSETGPKLEHKKPGKKQDEKSSVSLTKNSKSAVKDKSNQKTSDSSKNVQGKPGSDRKQTLSSSDKKREDGKKQSSNSTRAENGSFKKPGEIQHQPRLRSNSSRRMDSDFGHFHDEDILSIMADDDGFEREMKTYTSAGGRSGSRSSRGSRERGNQVISSRNSSMDRNSCERPFLDKDGKGNEQRPHSRDRGSEERRQLSKDGGSGELRPHSRDRGSRERRPLSNDRGSRERQQHHSDRDNKYNYDSKFKPGFDKRAKGNAKRFGEVSRNVNKSSSLRRPARIQNYERNRSGTSSNRFRPSVSKGLRHTYNRQDSRQSGRNNNNTVGGRSSFFVASKIKDSYFKRRQTFQGVENKRFDSRQNSKPVNAHKQSLSAQQQKHGKNEIGITGAILKDDRIRENSRSSDFKDRDHGKQDDVDKRGNVYDRSYRSVSLRQNNVGNTTENILQRDGTKFDKKERFSYRPFKRKGLASQRVKQKYFRGGFGQNRNSFRGGQKNDGRQKQEKPKQWDRKSVVDGNNFLGITEQGDIPNTEQQLHDQSLELNQQQVIFLPNADMQSGQPHMIDQFRQIILNPEVDVQQGEEQIPVQYLPQQFHPDGVPPGEQVVFIPFVNNQVPSGYTENLPLAYEENPTYDENPNLANESSPIPDGRQNQNSAPSVFKSAANKKKPLSKQARANLRKSLEIKRKQRMEKEIEKKLLRKLLRNPDVNKAVRESNEVKKKPFIKRISPPNANKPNTSDKKYKLIRKHNNSGELEDVSEDETKYDNVSDLEDVSEFEDVYEGNDEYELRQGKRPVFRKPGQPRKNTNVSESSMIASTAGDIRRVVDYSSQQQGNRYTSKRNDQTSGVNLSESKQKSKQGEKGRRSVYIENSNDNVENVSGQKRVSDSSKYENIPLKKRRSISPIEITVSNDRYSKATSKNSGNESINDRYDSSKRKDERKFDFTLRYSEDGITEGRCDRSKNKSDDRHQDDRERKQKYENKGSRTPEKGEQANRNEKQHRKDGSYYLSIDAEENYRRKDLSESWEREQNSSGKYDDSMDYRKDEEKNRNWHKKEKNYNKIGNVKAKNEDRGGKNDERRGHGSDRRGDDSYRNRSDKDDRKRDRSRDRSRNERRSLSRDRSLPESRNVGHSNLKQERNRGDNQDQGSNRNLQGNNFISSMSQNQFQMNQPLIQQSMQHQPFITAQSHTIPFHGQSVVQFPNSGNNVDHSLPPVQNSPMSMPPYPPPALGARPDMSLPPPLMNVVGTPTSVSTMVLQQQPNSVQFQQQPIQQLNMQQQPIQHQQQFPNMQPQFQQQQFQQMQSQPQIIQQQSNVPNFQSNQSFHSNIQSNQQVSLQQMQSGQFQQTQSGLTMMSVNQNQMQNQQTGSVNQGQTGASQQGIQTSGNRPFVATTPQQAMRGVIRAQPVRIATSINQVSHSPTMSRRAVNTKQSSFIPGRSFGSRYLDDEDNEVDEDDFLEMLCSKCDKVFLSHEVMRRHGRWHDMVESNTKNWRCDQCEQGFSSSAGHSEHMSVKHSRESWNCSLCDMTFSNSSGLNRHVRHASHKDLKVKFVCSLCPASFMVLMHLVQHKKDNHQSNMGYSGLRKY